MTLLSRLQTLGLAKETTPGTYQAPVTWVPVTGPKPEDLIAELRDESIRGNDTLLQGIYGGAGHSTFDYTIPHLYPDVIGDHLRAILGPDTLTAGVTTTLSAATTAGATSITAAASIPAGTTIQIDTGSNAEYATTGAPSGAGPYTIPLTATGTGTALAKPHAAAAAVAAASVHLFEQDGRVNPIPSYSLTQYNKIETRGYPGCILSDLGIKIDPKAAVAVDAKWLGFLSATQPTVTPGFSTAQPLLGWQWALTLAGVASTRGITGDYTLKRATTPLVTSDGKQSPREIFPSVLEVDFKMKAIFEDNKDLNQFLGYTSVPVVSTLTQPLAFGGAVVSITSTGQKFIKFAPDYATANLEASIDAAGVFNTADNGAIQVSVTNFRSTAY